MGTIYRNGVPYGGADTKTIAPTYSSSGSVYYYPYDVVYYQGKYYVCKVMTYGTFNPDRWEEIQIGSYLGDVDNRLAGVTIKADSAYDKGVTFTRLIGAFAAAYDSETVYNKNDVVSVTTTGTIDDHTYNIVDYYICKYDNVTGAFNQEYWEPYTFSRALKMIDERISERSVEMTQAEYDALAVKDPNVTYNILEEGE